MTDSQDKTDTAQQHQERLPAADVEPRAEAVVDEDVQIPAGGTVLEGHLYLPAVNAGVVIIAHGDGNAHGLRLDDMALALQRASLGTLMVDLFTSPEGPVRAGADGLDPLAQRLTAAAAWLHQQPGSMSSGVGYCGTGVGAAAALWAAGEPGARVEAIVSLGGRTDLTGPRLAHVQAATLLIVGDEDREDLGLNRQAQAQLRGENRLAVVEGVSHQFKEPGTLETAAELARDWFTRYLAPAQGQTEEVSR